MLCGFYAPTARAICLRFPVSPNRKLRVSASGPISGKTFWIRRESCKSCAYGPAQFACAFPYPPTANCASRQAAPSPEKPSRFAAKAANSWACGPAQFACAFPYPPTANCASRQAAPSPEKPSGFAAKAANSWACGPALPAAKGVREGRGPLALSPSPPACTAGRFLHRKNLFSERNRSPTVSTPEIGQDGRRRRIRGILWFWQRQNCRASN